MFREIFEYLAFGNDRGCGRNAVREFISRFILSMSFDIHAVRQKGNNEQHRSLIFRGSVFAARREKIRLRRTKLRVYKIAKS